MGEFLINLGEQLREADTLTISDDEWELPFGEPVELEIDFDGVGEPEPEIEVKLTDELTKMHRTSASV